MKESGTQTTLSSHLREVRVCETITHICMSKFWQINRAEVIKVTADANESGRTSSGSDDPKLSKLVQLQVAECLPRTDHSDICKKEREEELISQSHSPEEPLLHKRTSFRQRHLALVSHLLPR